MRYIAFLRGINVGGKTKVPMSELKKTLEELGFTDVKTLLNSGNVVFSSDENSHLLSEKIEQKLEKTFGFFIRVMVRTQKEIQELIDSDPFKHVTITPETRLYITFLSDEAKGSLEIPYESPEKDFGILRVTKGEIISYLQLSAKRGTVDLMNFIGKEFTSSKADAGKNVTTRNWNTVLKLSNL